MDAPSELTPFDERASRPGNRRRAIGSAVIVAAAVALLAGVLYPAVRQARIAAARTADR